MKTIVFDIDDTLYDLCWPYAQALHVCFDGAYDDMVDKIFPQTRIHSDEVFEEWQSGRMKTDDMYAYRNQKSFEDFGIIITREQALNIQHRYKDFQKKIYLTEDVKRMLDACKESGVTMGVISNGLGDHQRGKIATLGLESYLPEEHIIISGDVGTAKPGVEIYHIAAERLQADPADTWYIGDTFYNDVVGAKAAGWHVLWLNRRGNIMPAEGPMPDLTVTTVAEMADAVCELVKA